MRNFTLQNLTVGNVWLNRGFSRPGGRMLSVHAYSQSNTWSETLTDFSKIFIVTQGMIFSEPYEYDFMVSRWSPLCFWPTLPFILDFSIPKCSKNWFCCTRQVESWEEGRNFMNPFERAKPCSTQVHRKVLNKWESNLKSLCTQHWSMNGLCFIGYHIFSPCTWLTGCFWSLQCQFCHIIWRTLWCVQ